MFVKSDGTAVVYANKVYRQQSQPTQSNTNDIWFDTCEPNKAYIKDSLGWEETELVQIPQTVTVKSNVISAIETIAYYNDNGAEKAIVSNYDGIKKGLAVDYSAGVSIPNPHTSAYTCPEAGFCVFRLMLKKSEVNIRINGYSTGLKTSNWDVDNDNSSISFFVAKGDVISLDNNPAHLYEGKFFPLKGVI